MLHANKQRVDIADMFPKHSVGAEIGVFLGRFAKALAIRAVPRRFYLIDPWWVLHGENFRFRPSLSTRAAYASTAKRMRRWIDDKSVMILVQRSQDALSAMDDAHLDWAYLDSSHDYSETLKELYLLKNKVKHDGIICGHDFKSHRHPGVYGALTTFLKESPEFDLFYLDNHSQWAVRRRIK